LLISGLSVLGESLFGVVRWEPSGIAAGLGRVVFRFHVQEVGGDDQFHESAVGSARLVRVDGEWLGYDAAANAGFFEGLALCGGPRLLALFDVTFWKGPVSSAFCSHELELYRSACTPVADGGCLIDGLAGFTVTRPGIPIGGWPMSSLEAAHSVDESTELLNE